jgi:protein-disulfide isomerase
MQEDQSVMGLSGSPKTMFQLGFAGGVGVAAIAALVLVIVFMMSGGTFGAMTGDKLAAAPNANNPSAPTPTPADNLQLPPAGPVKPVDEKSDHILGNKNAKVTLIEYSDFECPFCLRHEDTLKQLMSAYKNDVRLVYRHFPLSFHPQAQKAAEASECAGKQGKFWEMHGKIFAANQAGKMSVQQWKDDAKALGLNADAFNKCLDSGETAAKIAQDQQEGSAAGITGTPGTFVNGKLVEGAVPLATFKQIVEQEGAKN